MAVTFCSDVRLRLSTVIVALATFSSAASAQNGVKNAAGPAPVNAAVGDDGFLGPGGPNNGPNLGASGGAASADFDSLIDLITSTVDAESWLENGTGEGDIQEFANGVYVDAAGALRMKEGNSKGTLASIRDRGRRANGVESNGSLAVSATKIEAKSSDGALAESDAASARTASPLRYVSLSRLEAAIADCQRRHVPLDEAMLSLAGLQRVSYVLVYPELGDLVLAGPAGDWQATHGGGLVAAETGKPLVRLDDLLTLWRRQRAERSSAFGCSIVPRQEALARTQEFLAASATQPLEPSERRAWLTQLRDTVGVQDVEYYNLDVNTRLARLLLAADYHMKLVGMGLAEGVPGVKSYLATVRVGPDGNTPPMSVLRWWFAMPAASVETSADHDAFAMPEKCVQVLSESELLAARGERIHTGQSDELNSRFAESFTAEFAALADKYPLYGELERVFELALALVLIESEGLTEKVGWTPSLLVDGDQLRLPESPAPQAVETVINHRVIGGRHIIAGVSGGVWVDGGKSLAVKSVAADGAEKLASVKKARDAERSDLAWWWD